MRVTSYDGKRKGWWHPKCYVAWGNAALKAIQNAVAVPLTPTPPEREE